ncbi:GlsB/YeaQ/YmgE family stress response membrane protein [Ramlibacter alkalitolerans]|jgi:uncharacterized membrane protein YeaQ/YmgE (transglycosylase-associated protein family)|uniref:GlsB/YeaQ/YmgE family stress response membrane protein n=1 Tax=Ramlibacter alkalitolerans TaxID=2039631 RepID=A0ABS1JJR8_9BURK|nr:hypothetical protein [Ramlibacter alkalitolerans]MBL0424462.1 hypothetical protein [Ramlibacter alkalitolerans]
MNPFIWCVVGAAAGWMAGTVMRAPGLASRVENVLVAIFGAFIGGEFLAALLAGPEPATAFRTSALGLAIAGALGLLGLLAVFRKAVGPMRPHKLRRKARP